MNRLPQVVVLLSAAVAIFLWLLATWLEGADRAIGDTGSPDSPSMGHVRPDSQTQASVGGAPCDDVEAEIRDLVQQSRSCATDADCAIFDYGYPIECLTSVARSEISFLRTQFRRYHESCEYRVYYDCPTGESSRRPVCRNRQCEVELTDPDSLQDETLDYLGIGN